MADRKVRILLAEDQPDISRMYEAVLKSEEFEVETAFDGLAALAKAQAGGFDLILLDIRMPQMTGLGVLSGLKNSPAKKENGPIVMLTSIGDEKVVREAMSLGATSYMDKAQLNPTELVEKINGMLGRSSQD